MVASHGHAMTRGPAYPAKDDAAEARLDDAVLALARLLGEAVAREHRVFSQDQEERAGHAPEETREA